jgi:hypothetical protein
MADQWLDAAMDSGEEWALRIRNLKFEAFNQEWLQQAQGGDGGDSGGDGGGAACAPCDSGELGSWQDGDFTLIGGQRVVDLEGFSASRHLWAHQGEGEV